MNFERYSKEFTEKAKSVGYSSENIINCLAYAKPLLDQEVPVIYNISHLSGLVGYKQKYLTRAVYYTSYFYRHFFVKKNNGTLRNISEPLPNLKDIQLWILDNILYKIPVSKFAKAYIPKINLKQNVIWHKNQPLVLTLDIENFFSSIRKKHVQQIFESIGYSPIVSNLLTKLCILNEVLPQGAPTSPYLSNIFMRTFDENLGQYCLKQKIRWTRYADDLTFSGTFDSEEIIKFVNQELRKIDLSLNDRKTKIMKKGSRQIVTGIVVNEKMQVVRYKRKRIRQEVYYIKKFTLQNHIDRAGIDKKNYLLHLIGEINFLLFINPDDEEFKKYQQFLISLGTESSESE